MALQLRTLSAVPFEAAGRAAVANFALVCQEVCAVGQERDEASLFVVCSFVSGGALMSSAFVPNCTWLGSFSFLRCSGYAQMMLHLGRHAKDAQYNPRFFHCYAEEDGMKWLKGVLS